MRDRWNGNYLRSVFEKIAELLTIVILSEVIVSWRSCRSAPPAAATSVLRMCTNANPGGI